MEESSNENEAQQSFRSPPRRRRSTFFERRESLGAVDKVPQTIIDDVDPYVCKKSADEEKHNKELSRYYDKLLSEKDQWKKEVKKRRSDYHDIKKQYQMEIQRPSKSRLSYSVLSKEDIEFLNGKTNYSKLVDSQMKLHKSVKETRALYRRACELDDVILNHCEDRLNKITDYILDHSTVEPMETN